MVSRSLSGDAHSYDTDVRVPTDGLLGPEVLEPRTEKRSVGSPPIKWTDDIKIVASSCKIQVAQDRERWKSLQEASET